jgi:type I restriction enzyme S subunit
MIYEFPQKFIDEKKTYISTEKYKTLKKHTIRKGDIIFSSFISENIRTVVLPDFEGTAIAKADCFCLRPIENLTLPHFLTYILSSQIYHDYLQSKIHGATRPRINTAQLKNTPIPIPPLEEQKEIVRQVDKLFSFADKLERHYQKAKDKLDKLPQSVLAKAFRGKLVPTEAELARKQGRDYETAQQLLERIKIEKKRLEQETKKGKHEIH